VGLVVGVFLATSLPSDDAFAKRKSGVAKAKRFERSGKKAYKRKRWDDAIAAFKLAYEAHARPRYLFNTARAYEKKGDLLSAIDYVQRFVGTEDRAEERADGEELLAILESKLRSSASQVRFTSEPAGARVLVEGDGRKLTGTTPWSTWLTVGEWRVVLSAEDLAPVRKRLMTQAGVPQEVHARFVVGEAEPDPWVAETETPAAPTPAAPSPPDRSVSRWLLHGSLAAAGGGTADELLYGRAQVAPGLRVAPWLAVRAGLGGFYLAGTPPRGGRQGWGFGSLGLGLDLPLATAGGAQVVAGGAADGVWAPAFANGRGAGLDVSAHLAVRFGGLSVGLGWLFPLSFWAESGLEGPGLALLRVDLGL